MDATAMEQLPDGDDLCGIDNAMDTFQVQQGWNCEILQQQLEVQWKVLKHSAQFELVERLSEGSFISFGLSGSVETAELIGR